MRASRRNFLKSSALVASLPLLRGPSAQAHPHPSDGASRDPLPNLSAGLLFDRADVPRIRANLALPRFDHLRHELKDKDHDADLHFLTEELRLTNRVQDMARARTLLEENAFAYVIWGDPRQLEVARTALRRLMDYPTWDYFTEGGTQTIAIQRASEATIAVCCALDWLGTELTEDEINEAERQVATKGAPACYLTLYGMKYPDRVRGWGFEPTDDYSFKYDLRRWPLILNATNLKVIPTCGLAFAAVWLHGRHPEANKWLEMSRQSAQAFSVMYGQDGSYDEGIGYWGYTSLHLAMQAEVIYRRLGIDDRDLINYSGTARFALLMSMPALGEQVRDIDEGKAYNATPRGTYKPALDSINIGDSGTTGVDVSVAGWIGRVANDPVANHIANEVGYMRHIPSAIWYDPDAPTALPSDDLLDVRMSNDWVISRTGWRPEDTVVALRSGGPANHEHADRNSVIFKAHGERLFHDPFKAGYSTKLPSWALRLTPAHTAVLINGEGHQYHDGSEGVNSSWASASVLAYATGSNWMTVTSDATSAYQMVNDAVQRIDRSLVLLKPDVLIMLDRVTLDAAHAAPVQVRYQVFNQDGKGSTAASAHGFTITRPHASLAATVHSPSAYTTRTAVHDLPADHGVHPYAEVESASAAEHTILTVSAARSSHGVAPAPTITTTANGWIVAVTQGDTTHRVTIDTTATLPALTVS